MTQYSVVGDSKVWAKATYSGNSYANINGYNAGANEDWLLTPQLTPGSSEGITLTFRSAMKFNGNPLQLKYSTNYTGSNGIKLKALSCTGTCVCTEGFKEGSTTVENTCHNKDSHCNCKNVDTAYSCCFGISTNCIHILSKCTQNIDQDRPYSPLKKL